MENGVCVSLSSVKISTAPNSTAHSTAQYGAEPLLQMEYIPRCHLMMEEFRFKNSIQNSHHAFHLANQPFP